MGRSFLAVHDNGFHVPEAGVLQQISDLHFGKSQVGIGVQLAGLVEGVLKEIKDHQPAPRLEDAVHLLQGACGVGSVVESLAEEGEVDGVIIDGKGLNVAQPEFEVGQPVLTGELFAEGHHFLRMVDGNDMLGTLGEELGESAFARSKIRDDLEVEDLEQAFGECLPRTARHVMTAEFPSQLVEVGPGTVLSLPQDLLIGP